MTWTKDYPVQRRLYASPSLSDLLCEMQILSKVLPIICIGAATCTKKHICLWTHWKQNINIKSFCCYNWNIPRIYVNIMAAYAWRHKEPVSLAAILSFWRQSMINRPRGHVCLQELLLFVVWGQAKMSIAIILLLNQVCLIYPLQWRHYELDDVSNHRRLDC